MLWFRVDILLQMGIQHMIVCQNGERNFGYRCKCPNGFWRNAYIQNGFDQDFYKSGEEEGVWDNNLWLSRPTVARRVAKYAWGQASNTALEDAPKQGSNDVEDAHKQVLNSGEDAHKQVSNGGKDAHKEAAKCGDKTREGR
ncbi:hypothetical protein Tco_0830838 [Tanacetum coccineum]